MASLQAGEFRVVLSTGEFVRSLMEGRARLSSIDPLLHHLRTHPRILVRAERNGNGWAWSLERPGRHLIACDQPGWLLGLERRKAQFSIFTAPTDDIRSQRFAFGFPEEVHQGDIILIGTERERCLFERHGRKDLLMCHFDALAHWRTHRLAVRAHLPEFGPEYAVVLASAERAEGRFETSQELTNEQHLSGLQSIAHALLLSVALQALRGDFS